MSNFAFYHGDDRAVINSLRLATRSVWSDIEEISVDSFRLFLPSNDYHQSFCETRNALGAVSGYVRAAHLEHSSSETESLDMHHNQRFISEMIKDDSWPLGDQWTGSFAAVAYSRANKEVFICNDPVGYFPIYLSTKGGELLGGTSLIVLSHCKEFEVDVIGVLQRISPPYCNYGRRTLLKQVERILPGERVKVSDGGLRTCSVFDNSLCNGLINADVDTVARNGWDCLQREISLATGINDRTCVAMSGGWDSRLALAGLSHRGGTVDCYTYGSENLYETQIAKRCAMAIGAQHNSFSIEDNYFPPRNDLENIIRKAEVGGFHVWCTIFDALKSESVREKPILLIGDFCESIDGRNLTGLSSRAARKRSFINSLFYGIPDQIPIATTAAFEQWKQKKEEEIIKSMLASIDGLSPDMAGVINKADLTEEMASDLNLSFSRVHQNMPAFVPMFDELFSWFHRARFLMASQAIMLSSLFRPVCPAMSIGFLRLISRIHPRLRIRRRLMDAIARLPEFDNLAKIPSAQIPWLSARAPSILREVLWGVRSGLDQLLIKRVLRNGNAQARQRVLRSLDYISEYRREGVIRTIDDWFSGKWIKSDKYLNLAKERAELSRWPLISLDIATPASVSILLDLCQQARIQHEDANPVEASCLFR